MKRKKYIKKSFLQERQESKMGKDSKDSSGQAIGALALCTLL